MSKTLEIKKSYIISLPLSFIFGFGILFGLEHFGKFNYNIDADVEPGIPASVVMAAMSDDQRINSISFISFFDNEIKTGANGYVFSDLKYSDSAFYTYKNKLYYYTEAVKKDFKYGLTISFAIFCVFIFLFSFKIKLV